MSASKANMSEHCVSVIWRFGFCLFFFFLLLAVDRTSDLQSGNWPDLCSQDSQAAPDPLSSQQQQKEEKLTLVHLAINPVQNTSNVSH